MIKNRVLFISDYLPNKVTSGGIVLIEEIEHLSQYFEFDFLLFDSTGSSYSAYLPEGSGLFVRPKLAENLPLSTFPRFQYLLDIVWLNLVVKYWSRKERKHLKTLLELQRYDYIFLTLEGLHVSEVVNPKITQGLKLVLQYWDPETWWAKNHNFSKYSRKRIIENHTKLEKVSVSVIVPSSGMKDKILERSKKRDKDVYVLYPRKSYLKRAAEESFENEKTSGAYSKSVFLVGGIYALPEILQFIKALENVRSRHNIDIGFFIVGPEIGSSGYAKILKEGNARGGFVHFIEKVSPDLAESLMADADLNFLPYPFSFRDLAVESFPSKFAKYIGAKRPILIFAPHYSSLIKTLKSNGLSTGMVTETSIGNLTFELERLLIDEQYNTEHLKELVEIEKKMYSEELFDGVLGNAFNTLETKLITSSGLVERNLELTDSWVTRLNSTGRSSWLFRNLGALEQCRRPLGRILPNLGRLILGERRYLELRSQFFR